MNQIKYKIIGKYQLAESITFQTEIYPDEDISTRYIKLTKEGKLTLRYGYASDGPSGPTKATQSAPSWGDIFHSLCCLKKLTGED